MSLCILNNAIFLTLALRILLITVAISGTRFVLVCIYKSMPVMDDPLLLAIITRNITICSVMAGSFKLFYEGIQHDLTVGLHLKILSGRVWHEADVEELPLHRIVALMVILLDIFFKLAIFSQKNRVGVALLPQNHQNATISNLGTHLSTSFVIILAAPGVLLHRHLR